MYTVQSKQGFKTDKTCYYTIMAPPQVPTGDLIYLSFASLSNVDAFVSIDTQLQNNGNLVTCQVTSGSTIVARTPDKFIISFKSVTSDNSKFYFTSWFAPYDRVSETEFENAQLCSDSGANLDGIITPSKNNGSS